MRGGYCGSVGNPMDIASAMMAFQRDAVAQIGACKAELAASGRGLTADDRAAIAAAAAAQPFPPGYDPNAPATPVDVAAAQAVAAKAMSADYPKDGFADDDPRVQPIEGVSLALFAIGAQAIGWSTDPALISRVSAALGIDPVVWERATGAWSVRIADDIVVAAFYGQLFAQASAQSG